MVGDADDQEKAERSKQEKRGNTFTLLHKPYFRYLFFSSAEEKIQTTQNTKKLIVLSVLLVGSFSTPNLAVLIACVHFAGKTPFGTIESISLESVRTKKTFVVCLPITKENRNRKNAQRSSLRVLRAHHFDLLAIPTAHHNHPAANA